jgi:hypothetical protein
MENGQQQADRNNGIYKITDGKYIILVISRELFKVNMNICPKSSPALAFMNEL